MIVLGTGVLLAAAADADDHHHEAAAGFFDAHRGERAELVLVPTVATEAAWMIEDRVDSATEAAFVSSIVAGDFRVVELTTVDWDRSAQLIGTCADLGLGLVDASLVVVAERLGVATLAIFNQRHFRVARPVHVEVFELVR